MVEYRIRCSTFIFLKQFFPSIVSLLLHFSCNLIITHSSTTASNTLRKLPIR